ncbi:MAG: hypothetical protein WCP32_19155 [Bacteroidota bacterium]
MKKNQTLAMKFQIRAIELLETCINSPKLPLGEETVFQFDINLEHRIVAEKGIVIVICSVSVLNEDREQLFGKLKSSCLYDVENLSEFINPDTKSVELPEPFGVTLNSVSLSTTRGLMFSFFRGTFLHNAIMPILDPTTFMMDKK